MVKIRSKIALMVVKTTESEPKYLRNEENANLLQKKSARPIGQPPDAARPAGFFGGAAGRLRPAD
jgi:hypothetical protein